jgi:hypothetical protein
MLVKKQIIGFLPTMKFSGSKTLIFISDVFYLPVNVKQRNLLRMIEVNKLLLI